MDECKAELEAERTKVIEQIMQADPVIEPSPATLPKQVVERPRKVVVEADPQPVRWWARGSKWDTEDE